MDDSYLREFTRKWIDLQETSNISFHKKYDKTDLEMGNNSLSPKSINPPLLENFSNSAVVDEELISGVSDISSSHICNLLDYMTDCVDINENVEDNISQRKYNLEDIKFVPVYDHHFSNSDVRKISMSSISCSFPLSDFSAIHVDTVEHVHRAILVDSCTQTSEFTPDYPISGVLIDSSRQNSSSPIHTHSNTSNLPKPHFPVESVESTSFVTGSYPIISDSTRYIEARINDGFDGYVSKSYLHLLFLFLLYIFNLAKFNLVLFTQIGSSLVLLVCSLGSLLLASDSSSNMPTSRLTLVRIEFIRTASELSSFTSFSLPLFSTSTSTSTHLVLSYVYVCVSHIHYFQHHFSQSLLQLLVTLLENLSQSSLLPLLVYVSLSIIYYLSRLLACLSSCLSSSLPRILTCTISILTFVIHVLSFICTFLCFLCNGLLWVYRGYIGMSSTPLTSMLRRIDPVRVTVPTDDITNDIIDDITDNIIDNVTSRSSLTSSPISGEVPIYCEVPIYSVAPSIANSPFTPHMTSFTPHISPHITPHISPYITPHRSFPCCNGCRSYGCRSYGYECDRYECDRYECLYECQTSPSCVTHSVTHSGLSGLSGLSAFGSVFPHCSCSIAYPHECHLCRKVKLLRQLSTFSNLTLSTIPFPTTSPTTSSTTSTTTSTTTSSTTSSMSPTTSPTTSSMSPLPLPLPLPPLPLPLFSDHLTTQNPHFPSDSPHRFHSDLRNEVSDLMLSDSRVSFQSIHKNIHKSINRYLTKIKVRFDFLSPIFPFIVIVSREFIFTVLYSFLNKALSLFSKHLLRNVLEHFFGSRHNYRFLISVPVFFNYRLVYNFVLSEIPIFFCLFTVYSYLFSSLKCGAIMNPSTLTYFTITRGLMIRYYSLLFFVQVLGNFTGLFLLYFCLSIAPLTFETLHSISSVLTSMYDSAWSTFTAPFTAPFTLLFDSAAFLWVTKVVWGIRVIKVVWGIRVVWAELLQALTLPYTLFSSFVSTYTEPTFVAVTTQSFVQLIRHSPVPPVCSLFPLSYVCMYFCDYFSLCQSQTESRKVENDFLDVSTLVVNPLSLSSGFSLDSDDNDSLKCPFFSDSTNLFLSDWSFHVERNNPTDVEWLSSDPLTPSIEHASLKSKDESFLSSRSQPMDLNHIGSSPPSHSDSISHSHSLSPSEHSLSVQPYHYFIVPHFAISLTPLPENCLTHSQPTLVDYNYQYQYQYAFFPHLPSSPKPPSDYVVSFFRPTTYKTGFLVALAAEFVICFMNYVYLALTAYRSPSYRQTLYNVLVRQSVYILGYPATRSVMNPASFLGSVLLYYGYLVFLDNDGDVVMPDYSLSYLFSVFPSIVLHVFVYVVAPIVGVIVAVRLVNVLREGYQAKLARRRHIKYMTNIRKVRKPKSVSSVLSVSSVSSTSSTSSLTKHVKSAASLSRLHTTPTPTDQPSPQPSPSTQHVIEEYSIPITSSQSLETIPPSMSHFSSHFPSHFSFHSLVDFASSHTSHNPLIISSFFLPSIPPLLILPLSRSPLLYNSNVNYSITLDSIFDYVCYYNLSNENCLCDISVSSLFLNHTLPSLRSNTNVTHQTSVIESYSVPDHPEETSSFVRSPNLSSFHFNTPLRPIKVNSFKSASPNTLIRRFQHKQRLSRLPWFSRMWRHVKGYLNQEFDNHLSISKDI